MATAYIDLHQRTFLNFLSPFICFLRAWTVSKNWPTFLTDLHILRLHCRGWQIELWHLISKSHNRVVHKSHSQLSSILIVLNFGKHKRFVRAILSSCISMGTPSSVNFKSMNICLGYWPVEGKKSAQLRAIGCSQSHKVSRLTTIQVFNLTIFGLTCLRLRR